MREVFEVWERRPGGRWSVVHSGSRDACYRFVRRQVGKGEGVRCTAPVEFVVLRVGDWPDDATPLSGAVA